jgi:hypothetical protein
MSAVVFSLNKSVRDKLVEARGMREQADWRRVGGWRQAEAWENAAREKTKEAVSFSRCLGRFKECGS